MIVAQELKEIKRAVAEERAEIPDSKRPAGEAQVQASRDTKKITLDPSRLDDQFLTIGGALNQK